MRDTSVLRRRGFTLIELMVVVTIIAILAALIVPALQRAQAAAMSRACMSRARAIGMSIRTYASGWDSWTNLDRNYFVKEFGYALSSEDGYVAGDTAYNWISDTNSETYHRQQSAEEFRCPVDEAPQTNSHGVPTSYKVASAFAGRNLATLQGEANRILAVSERGNKRHPTPGQDGQERHYVMADQSVTLGYRGNFIPGLYLRLWNKNSSAGIRGVPESALPDADVEGEINGFFKNHNWCYSYIAESKVTSTDWTGQGGPFGGGHYWTQRHGNLISEYPYRLIARADGLIRFPSDDSYEVYSVSHDYASQYFGIGPEGVTNNETTSFQWWQKRYGGGRWAEAFGAGYVPVKGNTYYPVQATYEVPDAWGGGRWYYQWRTQTNPTWQDIPQTVFETMPR